MARPFLVFHFVDNNSKRGEVKLYPGGAETFEAIAAKGAAIASALQGVSDARLIRYEVTFRFDFDGGAEPEPDADLSSYLLAFYRNDDNVQSVRVPSPGRVPFEVAGAYAGIRVTRKLAQVFGVLGPLEALVAGVVDGLGRPYPATFSVGGRIKL